MTDRRLPTFILVGVSRAGTTTAFDLLSRHPQVCGALKKETRYFQAIRYGEPLAPLDDYRAFFRPGPQHLVVMESTPDYIYGGERTARAIKEVCDPRVAVILREPASRLVSFYRLMRSGLQLPADMSFEAYVERCRSLPDDQMDRRETNPYTGVWTGEYARFLPPWLELFGDRCDILFFDDFAADPRQALGEECRRLGIDPDLLPAQVQAENASRANRSAALQRLAAAVARRGRRVWHYHPRLAGLARRTYEAVNFRAADDIPIADAAVAAAREAYRPWNGELRAMLLAAGVTTLPGWLAQ
ncbi:MAG TPA: hypothetical protein VHE57_05885 [Mycobacteriales bacterium]|nr:hypothetical protein [Mycobacteriales bacterium]